MKLFFLKSSFFNLLFWKVLSFYCNFCNFNCSAQYQTGLHLNFFTCNLFAKNTRYPKPSLGYTRICVPVTLLSIKKK